MLTYSGYYRDGFYFNLMSSGKYVRLILKCTWSYNNFKRLGMHSTDVILLWVTYTCSRKINPNAESHSFVVVTRQRQEASLMASNWFQTGKSHNRLMSELFLLGTNEIKRFFFTQEVMRNTDRCKSVRTRCENPGLYKIFYFLGP